MVQRTGLTRLERRIIYELQGDLEATARPFLALADKLGISEDELIAKIREFEATGRIRRFGATLKHQRTGFGGNVMVVWRVKDEEVDEIGEKLAAFHEVTHCYKRPKSEKWPYNLYTMVHAKDEEACLALVREMAEVAGGRERDLLFSVKELKKTTMRYFFEEFGE